jgi:hypothetical protein
MIVTFAAKNFQTGLTVRFNLYTLGGILISQYTATEVGTIGIYYYNIPSQPGSNTYILIAEEITGIWKAYKELQL